MSTNKKQDAFSSHQQWQALLRKRFRDIKFILCLLLTITVASSALARFIKALTEKETKAITSIASLLASPYDKADILLREAGYIPNDEVAWRKYSPTQKILIAAAEAENFQAGSGAYLVARLAQKIKPDYESIGYAIPIRQFLVMSLANAPPANFKRINGTSVAPLLSPEVKQAILTLAEYVDSNAIGGIHNVLRHHCDLDDSTTIEILKDSKSATEALLKGFEKVPDNLRHSKLVLLVADIDMTYESARTLTSLNPYRPNTKPKAVLASRQPPIFPYDGTGPTSGGPTTGGSGGGGPFLPTDKPTLPQNGGMNADKRMMEQKFRNMIDDTYWEPSSKSFDKVKKTNRGFGGINFGESVTSSLGYGKLLKIEWIREEKALSNKKRTQKPYGKILFLFEDSKPRFFGPVLEEDAYIAMHIMKNPIPNSQWNTGDFIPLVGINGSTRINGSEYYKRETVTLHPELINTDLGWSAMVVDSIFINPSLITNLVKQSGDARGATRVQKWVGKIPKEQYSWQPADVGWKFFDVPMQVVSEGSRLLVFRSDDSTNNYSEMLRRTAFLGFTAFERSNPDIVYNPKNYSAFYREFYELIPTMTRSSRDFERINQFAAVLGIIRWAKEQGIDITMNLPKPTYIPTPKTFAMNSRGYVVPQGITLQSSFPVHKTNPNKIVSIKPGTKINSDITSVWFDGKPVQFDVNPLVVNGIALVPIRHIMRAEGSIVIWSQDPDRLIRALRQGQEVVLQIGNKVVYINGNPITLERAPKIVQNRTLVPVSFMNEVGVQVEYDPQTRQVFLTRKE